MGVEMEAIDGIVNIGLIEIVPDSSEDRSPHLDPLSSQHQMMISIHRKAERSLYDGCLTSIVDIELI